MIAELEWQGYHLRVDLARGKSVAIPLDPHGAQPSFFADAPARARPLRIGDYIGDVAQGGSCNAEWIEFVPHCHGTHTECIAHLNSDAGNVLELIDQQPCLARLVTLNGTAVEQCRDSYAVDLDPGETLLTLDELRSQADTEGGPEIAALLIRTMPNEAEKMTRDYAQSPSYPVLSNEAMQWLAAQELKHLLLDTPSLDRANDQGLLANHRCWWGMEGEITPGEFPPQRRSVTEMMYVPDEVADGYYWLNLELQPLVSDATSSRPVIYPVEITVQ